MAPVDSPGCTKIGVDARAAAAATGSVSVHGAHAAPVDPRRRSGPLERLCRKACWLLQLVALWLLRV